MWGWVIGSSAYFLRQYWECSNAENATSKSCDKYAQMAWEAQIMYQLLRRFKLFGSAALWEDAPPSRWPFPDPTGPVSRQAQELQLASMIPAIPKKGDPQAERIWWFETDSKGLPTHKARLAATVQVREEFLAAAKQLDSQIKQLESLLK